MVSVGWTGFPGFYYRIFEQRPEHKRPFLIKLEHESYPRFLKRNGADWERERGNPQTTPEVF